MEDQKIVFQLRQLFVPRLDGHFLRAPKSENYDQIFRCELIVHADQLVQVLLGVSLQSQDKEGDKSSAGVIAEVAALVELQELIGKKIDVASDIPNIAHIFGQLVPFLREKVNYFFSNNHMTLLMPPINTFDLVKRFSTSHKVNIVDRRPAANTSKPMEKT